MNPFLERIKKSSADGYFLVSAAPVEREDNPNHLVLDPSALLPGAKQVLLLFYRYGMDEKPAPEGSIPLSNYYKASNKGYFDAKAVAEEITRLGVPALHTFEVPLKHLALRGGGFLGKNGFYYHPEFGSLIHIQGILLAEKIGEESAKMDATPCPEHCQICQWACPLGALGEDGRLDISRCLRYHMLDNQMEEKYMAQIYQILGCEQCQTCCPKNQLGFADPKKVYPLREILEGSCIKALRQTAGKNFAKPANLKNQAIAYLANTGGQVEDDTLQALRQLEGEEVHHKFLDFWRKKGRNRG